jgi:hypothetical protein
MEIPEQCVETAKEGEGLLAFVFVVRTSLMRA